MKRRKIVAALAARQERERRQVEAIASAQVQKSLANLLRLTIAAFEIGAPISKAVATGLKPLESAVASASALGSMFGARRTALSVGSVVMSRDEPGTLRLASAYDAAVDFANKRLQLTEGELQSLIRTFRGDALRAVADGATVIEQAVQEAIRDVLIDGGGVREGRRAIRAAFERVGFSPVAPYRAEAIVRTQVQIAYSAGRQQSLADPEIQAALWGFEYTAAVDDRTTELCRRLDGVRRPKADPFWSRFTPPNHYNCRSTVIEIFNGDRSARETPIPAGVQPFRGFDFNPGNAYARMLQLRP